MTTIVSVTPLRVQEDSRTFKIAASFATFGHESVVVEGQPSSLDRAELPFRLISMGTKKDGAGRGPEADPRQDASNGRGLFRDIVELPYKILRAIAALPFKLIALCDDAGEPFYSAQLELRSNVLDRLNEFLARKLVKPIYDRLPRPLRYVYESLVGWACFVIYLTYFLYKHFLTPLRYLPRASLYYLHAPYYFPAVYLLCRIYRVAFIYDAHDFYNPPVEGHDAGLLVRRWIHPFLFRLERRCTNRAAAVVTVCHGVARLQEEAFGCQPRIVRNCHDYRLDRTPRIQ